MSKPLIALLGLIALGLLCFFCIRGHVPTIQTDLIARTSAALAAAGIPWASANADGRELILEGVAPNEESRKQAGGIARQVWGVRTVDNRLTVAMAEPTPEPASREVKGLTGKRNDKAWITSCPKRAQRLDANDCDVFDSLRETRDYDTHVGMIEVKGE